MEYPTPGSPEELQAFAALQSQLSTLFRVISQDDRKPHTVVVVPSLSMDPQELAKITGVHHYEERLLFMLMLLRLPRTRLIFVTSQPVHPSIVDYYLHLLAGVPTSHARRRLICPSPPWTSIGGVSGWNSPGRPCGTGEADCCR